MSEAVTIKAVDAALVSHYSGMSIDVAGTPTAVSVFLEEPVIEQYYEKVFPSIAIKLVSYLPDFEVSESVDDEPEEVGYNTDVTPYEREMRDRPLPYRLVYSIDSWHKDRAGEARDLLQLAMMQKTPPRGYITVSNIDSEDVECWVFLVGSVVGNDEHGSDYVIYHKTLTISIPVMLSLVEADDTTDEKVAMEAEWTVSLIKTHVDIDGEIEHGDEVVDVSFSVTDTDVELIP